MIEVAERDPKSLVLVVADMARSEPPLTAPFVAELARRLQGHSAALALPLTWVEQRLAESAPDDRAAGAARGQEQAADQVSISNSIGSLRLLGAMDWREFVETLSRSSRRCATTRPASTRAWTSPPATATATWSSASPRHSAAGEAEVASAAVAAGARRGGAAGSRRPHARTSATTWSTPGRARLERAVAMRAPLAHAHALRRGAPPARLVRRRDRHDHAAARAAAAGDRVAWLRHAARGAAGVAPGSRRSPSPRCCCRPASSRSRWSTGSRPLLAPPRPLPRMDFSTASRPTSRTLVVVPTMLGERPGHRRAGRGARGALPRQPRRAPALRAADRLPRRRQPRRCPATRRCSRTPRERIEALNRQLRRPARPRRRPLLPVPPAAALEPARGRLDGLRAQARQAGRAQRAAARRRRASASRSSSATPRRCRTCATSSRSTPTRSCRATRPRKFVATMAHPLNRAALRRPAGAPRVVDGYGILQPRVGVSLPAPAARATRACSAASRASTRTRAPCPTSTRTCSAKARSSARASTTSMRSSARSADRLPREPHPQPRPARRLLRARRAGQRRRSCSRTPVALRRRRQAPPPLDPRRLADRRAGCCRCACRARRRRRSAAQSAVGAVALEDPRQPAPQPGAGGADRAAAARLGACCRSRWLWTLAVVAVLFVPALLGLAGDLVAQARRAAAGARTCCGVGARPLRGSSRRRCWRWRLPALRGLVQPRRDRAHAVAPAVSRRGACSSGRPRPRRRSAAGDGDRRSRGNAAAHVRSRPALGAGHVRRPGRSSGPTRWSPRCRCCCCGSLSPALAWWLSRPLARRQSTLSDAAGAVPAHAGAPHLGLLRDLRRAAPTTTCRRTTCRSIRSRRSRTAPRRPTSACRCWPTSRRTTSATSPPAELIERTGATLDTLDALERYRGHFYNWYDTQTLQPLRPRYVSTVDSGNLAGHLLTLRAGLLALADAPLHDDRAVRRPAPTRCGCCSRRCGSARRHACAAGALRGAARRTRTRRRSRPPRTPDDCATLHGRR